jgi:hypothetical protein
MHGLADDLSAAERVQRDEAPVPNAPKAIQDMFDTMLKGVAHRWGYKSVAKYVDEKLHGVVYQFTLNFMGGHTPLHADELRGDGPGYYIMNLPLTEGGLLHFMKVGEDKNSPVRAVWQRAGDCVCFSGKLRLTALHGVFKAGPVTQLTNNLENIRVVATIRAGKIPLEMQYLWFKKFGAEYDMETPADVQAAGVAPAEWQGKETPRSKRTASTLSPTPKLSGETKPEVKEMEDTGLEHMPVVGDKISAAQKTTWGECKVTGLYNNFATTDALPRTNTKQRNMCLQTGLQFCVQMQGMPKPLEYRVECVGIIYGPSTNPTRTRAAVMTRRPQGQLKWGKLETYDATHVPDLGFYQVDTHTYRQTVTHAKAH